MIGGRRVQWQRGELVFTESSAAPQVLVNAADWENTSAEGIEKGCTVMGVRLVVAYEIIDAVDSGTPLAFTVFKSAEGATPTFAQQLAERDIMGVRGPDTVSTFFDGTNYFCHANLNWDVKARRKIDSFDSLYFGLADITIFDIVAVIVDYSVLLAAP